MSVSETVSVTLFGGTIMAAICICGYHSRRSLERESQRVSDDQAASINSEITNRAKRVDKRIAYVDSVLLSKKHKSSSHKPHGSALAADLESNPSFESGRGSASPSFHMSGGGTGLEDCASIASRVSHFPGACPICLVEFEGGEEICYSPNAHCIHTFHRKCIVEWLVHHDECPCCRQPYLKRVKANEVQKNHFVETTEDLGARRGAGLVIELGASDRPHGSLVSELNAVQVNDGFTDEETIGINDSQNIYEDNVNIEERDENLEEQNSSSLTNLPKNYDANDVNVSTTTSDKHVVGRDTSTGEERSTQDTNERQNFGELACEKKSQDAFAGKEKIENVARDGETNNEQKFEMNFDDEVAP